MVRCDVLPSRVHALFECVHGSSIVSSTVTVSHHGNLKAKAMPSIPLSFGQLFPSRNRLEVFSFSFQIDHPGHVGQGDGFLPI